MKNRLASPWPVDQLGELLADLPAPPPDLLSMVQALREMGVVSAYPDLEGSPIDPKYCIPMIKERLDFLGHTGSKWRSNEDFAPMLTRLGSKGGEVRFLLSEDVSLQVCRDLRRLAMEHPCFRARIYTGKPLFRLVGIDGANLALQHYEGGEDVDIGENWDAPVLLIRPTDENAIFVTLAAYFEAMWTEARLLTEETDNVGEPS